MSSRSHYIHRSIRSQATARRALAHAIEPLEVRLVLSSLADFSDLVPELRPDVPEAAPGQQIAGAVPARETQDLQFLARNLPAPDIATMDRVSPALQVLYSRSLQGAPLALGQASIYGTAYSDFYVTDGVDPGVQLFVTDARQAAQTLAALGMKITAVTATQEWQVVAGYLPVNAVLAASRIPGLKTLAATERPYTNAGLDGEVNDAGQDPVPNSSGTGVNEWDALSGAEQLRRVLPATTGGGIDIGVMSDSINRVGGGVATSQASGDLPPGGRVNILSDFLGAGATDEGRAMAELVYDLGPDFDILYHTAFVSPADFATGIDDLRVAGADVIVDDISWFNEPFFQDGQVAQAIDTVTNVNGVLYFSSAGNRNNESYVGTWTNVDADTFHEFGVGDETINLTLSNNEKLSVFLQWDEAWGAAATDFDIEVWNSALNVKVADSNVNNIGGNPFDSVSFTNTTGASASFHLSFRYVGGAAPAGRVFKMVAPQNDDDFTDPYVLNQPGVVGHHGSEQGFGIGAVAWDTPGTIESFSSHGPASIFFTDAGVRLGAPVDRQQPVFTAADGTETTVPGFSNFFGTSAAAPNAAAVAGLLLEISGGAASLSRSEMFNLLKETATGTSAGSWDAVHGYGRINALGAGLVADGIHGGETFVELNPFGDFSSSAFDLFANSDIDSFIWASDTTGNATMTIGTETEPMNPGLLLWNQETGAFQEIDYDDGAGDDATITRNLSFWTRYQAEVFTEENIAAASGYTVTINAPTQPSVALGLDATGDVTSPGTIDDVSDSDYYSLVAPSAASGQVTIVLTPAAALNGVLILYDSLGNQITRANAGGNGGAETIVFNGVTPGATYYLRVGSSVYATSGTFTLDVNFIVPPSTISGQKYEDLNANGAKDSGEPGLSGWTIFLDEDNDYAIDTHSSSQSSPNVPRAIPDPGLVTSTLNVAGLAGLIKDVNVTLDITHTFDADLDVFLISPNGTRVELFTDVGGGGDHFTATTLDDEAATAITAGTAPFSGTFRPEGLLSGVDNEDPNGTWTLELTDDLGGFAGTLNSWSLFVSYGDPVTTTDASGNYSFANLPAGTHRVREVAQSLWVQTAPTGGVHAVTLVAGGSSFGRDFGNAQRGSIAGRKFEDAEGNGVLDGLDPTLPGWTIFLDYDHDGVVDNRTSTFSSSDVPKSILDSDTTNSLLTIAAAAGYIKDLNVNLDITHTFDADLDVFLVSPGGTRVELFTDVGGSGDNFTTTVLDDEAATAITAGVAPFTGSFRPEGLLSAFDAENPNGTWRLELTDDLGAFAGTLNSWSLTINYGDLTSVTGAGGAYAFNNLPPATYDVREVWQAGWQQTTPDEPSGLVGLYGFDGLNAVNQYGGPGALPNLTTSSVTFSGGDAVLNAHTDYLELPATFGNTPFTIWVDGTYTPQTPDFVFSQVGPTNLASDVDFVVQQFPGSNLRAEFYDDNGSSPSVSNGTIDAARHQIGMTWTGASLGLFYDQLLKSNAAVGGYPDIDGSVVRFGDRSLNDGIGLIGTIHEIRIYDRALSEDELAGLSNSTLGQTVVLGSGEAATNRYFGNARDGSVAGQKYHDLDGDGAKDIPEPGLPGWTILLDYNNNGIVDSGTTTVTSRDVPRAITDVETALSTARVSKLQGYVSDVNVTLDVTYSFDADLDVFLISPSGTRVELFTDVGGGGLNFTNTTLDDEAATAITAGAAPFTGSFRPEGLLSTLDGEDPNGVWTLELTDDFGGFAGTLNSWSLTIQNGDRSVVTGAAGTYSFANVPAGTHVVREIDQAGWVVINPKGGFYVPVVPSNSVVTSQDFGNATRGAISGIKFNDQDHDGVKDAPEPVLGGWTIFLDYNNNGLIDGASAAVPSSDVPRTVLDPGTTSSLINVSGLAGYIRDINVTLDISQTFDADMDVFLISPSGTRIELFTDVGSSGDNFTGTTLDDEAATAITAGVAPFAGAFRPESLLSAVDREDPNGAWRLELTDDLGGFIGTLNSWTLTIDYGDIAVVTDGAGAYSFGDMVPATYQIREVQQPGWFQTTPLTNTVDQAQLIANQNQALHSTRTVGQTFAAGQSGVLQGIELSMTESGTGGDLIVEILNMVGGNLATAPVVGSVSVPEAAIGPSPAVLNAGAITATYIDLSSLGIAVNAGDPLAVRLSTARVLPDLYTVRVQTTDVYPDGNYFVGTASTTIDMAFKVFVGQATSQSVPLGSAGVASGRNFGNALITHVTATNGDDSIYVQLDGAGTTIQIYVNVLPIGTPTYALPVASVPTLNILTLGGNDILTIDLVNGNPIPAGNLSYYGGPETGVPGDSLGVVGTGANAVIYTPSATTPGVGALLVDGRLLNFDDLEPINVKGLGLFSLVTPNQADNITITDTGAGQQQVTGTSGGIAFESVGVSSTATLRLDLSAHDGGAGNDVLSISGGDLPATGIGLLDVLAGTGANGITMTSGVANLMTSGANLTVDVLNAATLLNFAASARLSSLGITDATVVLLAGGAKMIVTDALAINAAGRLNLKDNDLLVKAAILSDIRSAIVAGEILTDSTVTTVPGKSTTLGYSAGNDVAIAYLGGNFNGEPFGGGAAIVKYTYRADGNLDGSVDGSDVALWAQNFSGALGPNPANPRIWTQGEWNGDGSVDGTDVSIWALNFTGALGGGGLGIEPSPTAAAAISADGSSSAAPATPANKAQGARKSMVARVGQSFSRSLISASPANLPTALRVGTSVAFSTVALIGADSRMKDLFVSAEEVLLA